MSGDCNEDQEHQAAGVRVVMLHLPEDEGEGLGFTLTRTMWDPYPWVREVVREGRADCAGLRSGDCLLQADGKDLLGLPVSQVARLIRGDGSSHGVSLLAWSCGTSPQDDPELLWSAGGGARGERSRRALSGVVRALACCVCAASAVAPRAPPAQCARGHLYCSGCRSRLQRCALCREPLPALQSPQARSLVAEQVFEAIASVYELKEQRDSNQQASTSKLSPPRRGSASQKNSPLLTRKNLQFGLSSQPHHGSDMSLNRPRQKLEEFNITRTVQASSQTDLKLCEKPPNFSKSLSNSTDRCCQAQLDKAVEHEISQSVDGNLNSINQYKKDQGCQTQSDIEGCCLNCLPTAVRTQSNDFCQKSNHRCQPRQNCQCCQSDGYVNLQCCYCFSRPSFSQQSMNLVPVSPLGLQNRLVARLRPASSLADLRRPQDDNLSKSCSNIHTVQGGPRERTSSVGDMPAPENNAAQDPLYVLEAATPLYVWAYPH